MTEKRPPVRSHSSPTEAWSTNPAASGASPSTDVTTDDSTAGSISSPWAGNASSPSHNADGAAGGVPPVANASATPGNTS